jgi:large subunit ribosomal protein L30
LELMMDIEQGEIRITQIRSAIGRTPTHRRTVRALGLRRIGHTVVQPDNPAIRGMVGQVGYLLKVEAKPAAGGGE